MATVTLIETTPGAGFNTQVDSSALVNKQPGVVAYSRWVPFAVSGGVGQVNRLQGISGAATATHEEFFFCISDRVVKDASGRPGETLAGLAAKGHTVFRSGDGNEINQETAYAPGYVWLMYGNSGTNNLTANYDHNPGLLLRHSLEQIHTNLNANIVARGNELKYYIGNFEYLEFKNNTGDPSETGPDYWNNTPNKNDSFYSPLSGGNTTLQDLYNQGGVALLNQHLHRKRAQMNALFILIMKRKNPSAKVCNGDFIPFHSPNINGDLITSQGTFAMTNYMNVPYSALLEVVAGNFGGMEPVVGGTVTLGGFTYNLSGREIDYYDLLNHYYYYNEIYIRQADWDELQSTTDPAKLTLDYWLSKFWFDRFHMYKLPISHALRRRFFDLHAQAGEKDLRGLRVIGMHEHMYECNKTYLTTNDSGRTYPTVPNYADNVPPPFLRWLTVGSQKLYIHKELIWTRMIQGAMCYGGIFVWWDTQGIDYSQGRYAQFHQRSQEWHQEALDYIRLDQDIWKAGGGRTYTDRGIQFRYRQNNGAWTEWQASPDPVAARFSNPKNRPYILLVSKGNTYYYAFFRGQEDSDVTDIEWKHKNATYSAQIIGCMPTTRAIRENLSA